MIKSINVSHTKKYINLILLFKNSINYFSHINLFIALSTQKKIVNLMYKQLY